MEIKKDDLLYRYHVRDDGRIEQNTCVVGRFEQTGDCNFVYYYHNETEFVCDIDKINQVDCEVFTTEIQRHPEELKVIFDFYFQEQEQIIENHSKKEIKRIRKLREKIKKN